MSTDPVIRQHHYKEASDNYYTAFFYTGEYESWQLGIVLKALDLSESDRLADIGGGTGRFASLIYEKAKLRQPVTCVDPSSDMLSQAKEFEGVEAICCSGVKFALKNDGSTYDRVLLKEVVHHLTEKDLETLFSCLLHKLSRRGKIVICTRPHEVEYPFFQAAHDVWKRNQSPKEYYVSLLEKTEFRVTSVSVFEYPASVKINWWTDMIKNRFWSTFSEFSDKELLAGINEIYKQYGSSDSVNFLEKYVLIVAEKKL